MRRFVRENSLGLGFGAPFLATLEVQAFVGHADLNADQAAHHGDPISLWRCATSSSFGVDVLENRQSADVVGVDDPFDGLSWSFGGPSATTRTTVPRSWRRAGSSRSRSTRSSRAGRRERAHQPEHGTQRPRPGDLSGGQVEISIEERVVGSTPRLGRPLA